MKLAENAGGNVVQDDDPRLNRYRHHFFKTGKVDGLVHYTRGTFFQSLSNEFIGSICGYENEYCHVTNFLDTLECLDSIDAWHPDVHQNHVKHSASYHLDGLVSVICYGNIKVLLFQDVSHGFQYPIIIINDQYCELGFQGNPDNISSMNKIHHIYTSRLLIFKTKNEFKDFDFKRSDGSYQSSDAIMCWGFDISIHKRDKNNTELVYLMINDINGLRQLCARYGKKVPDNALDDDYWDEGVKRVPIDEIKENCCLCPANTKVVLDFTARAIMKELYSIDVDTSIGERQVAVKEAIASIVNGTIDSCRSTTFFGKESKVVVGWL